MSVNCPDECFKIDMGCDCPPPPPDKPLPFMFILYNTEVVIDLGTIFYTHHTNPGKVGLSTSSTFIPNFTSYTFLGKNFPQSVTITLDPPPGPPGPGVVQATATMTINSTGDVTVTMTNNGAGYTTAVFGSTPVNYTLSNFNTIYVKNTAATTTVGMGAPVGRLSLPAPFGASLTLSSAKILPQINGYLTNSLGGGSPITVTGKWYKNGIQIGSPVQKVISTEGNHQWTHYCPATTFTNTEGLTYKFTCPDSELVNFTGIVEYFVQYF